VDPAFPQWCYMARPRGRGPAEGAAGEAIHVVHSSTHPSGVYHPRIRAATANARKAPQRHGSRSRRPRPAETGRGTCAPAVRRH